MFSLVARGLVTKYEHENGGRKRVLDFPYFFSFILDEVF
ncbi:hypothetical protein F652_4152 [Enterobacteriaceae bacterium bta3-1]|nr:hypothetical protein F652_4152 [Enterobacteriaceae bacterium bta3-1]